MDVDSIPSPAVTLSPNCESQQQCNYTSLTLSRTSSPASPRQSDAISDVAMCRLPLTAALLKASLKSEKGIRVASPRPEKGVFTAQMFEYYNSRGELVVPIEELPPQRIYAMSQSPPPYDVRGYFHAIYPMPPPNPIQSSNQPIPANIFEPLPTIPQPGQQIPHRVNPNIPGPIRLCKTKNCNAIIPFKHYKWAYCKRCTGYLSRSKADSHTCDRPSPSTSGTPRLPAPSLTSEPTTSLRKLKPLPLPARSAKIATVMRSISASESRRSSLSNSPFTTDPLDISARNAPVANTEPVTIGKKRSRYITEPILASTSIAESASVVMAVGLPSQTEPHTVHDSQRPNRSSKKSKHKARRLPKPTPPANSSFPSSSVPAPPPTTTSSKKKKLSDPWFLRINAGTEQRKCITPSCTNTIPSSSSPYTLRCLSCIQADWIARKQGIETLVQKNKAKITTAKSETRGSEKDERGVQDKKEAPSPKRRDSESSIISLLSLSSLTSLGDDVDDSDDESETLLNATPSTCVSELDLTPTKSAPKISLKFPGEVWRRAKNLRYCSEDGCCTRLKEGYDEATCVRCLAKRREKLRMFGVSCAAVWSMRGIIGDLRDVNDGDEEEEEVIVDDVIQGARLCASRWCSHVLPAKEEYKWNMCLGCRSYLVQEKQQSGQEGEANSGKKKVWGGRLTFGRNANEAEWRCSSLDCGMLVGDEGQKLGRLSISLCVQCIRRKAREAKRVERARAMGGLATSDSTKPEAQHSICKVPCYPEFISLSALLAQFIAELHSFLRDQATLVLRKKSLVKDVECSSSAPSTTPIMEAPVAGSSAPPSHSIGPLFTFKGQFSTVCNTTNILSPSHRTSILSHLVFVRSELERASLLKLRSQNPEDPLVTFQEGFAIRFACMHSIPLKGFLSGEHGHQSTNAEKQTTEREIGAADARKDFKGELDIIIVPDHSHQVIPGQMTIVKFRMGVINFS